MIPAVVTPTLCAGPSGSLVGSEVKSDEVVSRKAKIYGWSSKRQGAFRWVRCLL